MKPQSQDQPMELFKVGLSYEVASFVRLLNIDNGHNAVLVLLGFGTA